MLVVSSPQNEELCGGGEEEEAKLGVRNKDGSCSILAGNLLNNLGNSIWASGFGLN